jgi:hypothetical protein
MTLDAKMINITMKKANNANLAMLLVKLASNNPLSVQVVMMTPSLLMYVLVNCGMNSNKMNVYL